MFLSYSAYSLVHSLKFSAQETCLESTLVSESGVFLQTLESPFETSNRKLLFHKSDIFFQA